MGAVKRLLLALCAVACSSPPGLPDGGTAGGSSTAGGSTAGGTSGGSSTAGGSSAGGATAGGSAQPVIGQWVQLPSLPVQRQETGVAALNGELYVVGGFINSTTIVPTVEAYDPDAGTWRDAGSLPISIHHANVAALNGKLYVVGGLVTGFAATRAVYEYDPATRQWTPKTQMIPTTERGGSGVAVVGNHIYIAGGFRGGAVADFSRYDPVTDMHEVLAPLPAQRDHLVAGAVGPVIYIIGGRNSGIAAVTPRVDRYDTRDGGWSLAAPMLTARGGAAAGVSGSRILVAGGEGNRAPGNPNGVFPQVEVLDTALNVWLDGGVMRTPRHGTGGAVIDGVFYMPGGATTEAFGATPTVEAVPFPP